jgi:uncharacterized protein YaaN involved in tellurite resistance
MSDTTTTTATPVATFQLQPPEVITPVPATQVQEAVPLKAETVKAVDDQVGRFIDALMQEDLHSDAFRSKLDSAFALGREEISTASALMQNRFMQSNFVGMEDSPAYKAIAEIRGLLDELNPGKEGDLLQKNKLLGFIPYGNRLQAYFRKYQSASSQLQTAMSQVHAARDDMQKDVAAIDTTRAQVWEALQKLAAAARFATTLDSQLKDKVDALEATDAQKAQALKQEVLFYARQNLTDVLTQQAVTINAYLALGVLKQTAREMINGCSRVLTTGMSALATAQTVARATGNQIKVMEMLTGVNNTIGALIAESGKQLNQHVEQTTKFAENPMLGIEQMKTMFDQTFQAMDAMDTFRSKAIDVMGQNNQLIREQIARAESYVDKNRQKLAKDATAGAIEGPVKL